MRKYHTGLATSDWEISPNPPFKGKNFTINYRKIRGQPLASAREIIIQAKSIEAAQNALDLIIAGNILYSGRGIGPFYDSLYVYPFNKKEIKDCEYFFGVDFESNSGKNIIYGTLNTPACIIAAKASYRRNNKYALLKYLFSRRQWCNDLVDLDPSFGGPHLPITKLNCLTVRRIYAIVSAYSVIEEINLTINASNNNRSKIKDGEKIIWNPKVKLDLENRLKKAGVDIQKKFTWLERGRPTNIATKIAKKQPESSKVSAHWARGPYVRDKTIEFIEALDMASFLRSQVTAHITRVLTHSVSAYDVANVQSLARYLLLHKLGILRYGKNAFN